MRPIPNPAGEWSLLDENGGTAVNFTSFIDIAYNNEGQVLTYPVEEGSFANYNKLESPLDIHVNLAAQGTESDFEYILSRLDEYKRQAVKLSVSTPARVYENMTLKGYSYKRGKDSGAGMLNVELALVEVREVAARVGMTALGRPRNPTSASRVNMGKTQSTDPDAEMEALLNSVGPTSRR